MVWDLGSRYTGPDAENFLIPLNSVHQHYYPVGYRAAINVTNCSQRITQWTLVISARASTPHFEVCCMSRVLSVTATQDASEHTWYMVPWLSGQR